LDEQEAITRLKAGDIGGLEALVRRYQVNAVRAAYLVTRDRSLAEDLVQAAFLRAYERITQFDARRPFGPWFLRSVVNDAVKAAGRQQRQISLDDQGRTEGSAYEGHTTDRALLPEAVLERAESQDEVRAALNRLTPQQRAVLVRRYYLDQSEAEMAVALACPPGTVKRRLHTARGRLLALLRPGDGDAATGTPAPVADASVAVARPIQAVRRDD